MILKQQLDDSNFQYGDTSDGDTYDEHEGYGYDEQYD